MIHNLPNLLTIFRLILAPCISWSILRGNFHPAAVLVFAAGLTDALDGFLARRFAWTSRTGAYLDPIADKLLLVSSYIALGLQGAVPVWLVWLVLGRDAVILGMVGIAFLFTRVRTFPPTVLGKLSTIVQVLAALVVILDRAYVSMDYRAWESALVGLAAAVTILSGLHYMWLGATRFPGARRDRFDEVSR